MNKIEWLNMPGYTGETWNPVTGCTKISAGCANCWAEKMAIRNAGRCGYPIQEPFRVTFHPDRMNLPYTWKKPRMVFVCSMSDLFHEDVPTHIIHRIFNTITDERNEKHLFLILTKRPERMKEVVLGRYEIENRKIPSNIWLGVSVEDHKSAQERIPYLLGTPADKRFVSVEPMLSFINLTKLSIKIYTFLNSLKGFYHGELLPGMNNFISKLDWVIAGGESGPHARPMHPDWVRSIRDQCGQTGTPFFFKQWGAWMPESQITRDIKSYKINMMGKEIMHRVGKKAAGKVLDGVEHVEFPKIEAYAQ